MATAVTRTTQGRRTWRTKLRCFYDAPRVFHVDISLNRKNAKTNDSTHRSIGLDQGLLWREFLEFREIMSEVPAVSGPVLKISAARHGTRSSEDETPAAWQYRLTTTVRR